MWLSGHSQTIVPLARNVQLCCTEVIDVQIFSVVLPDHGLLYRAYGPSTSDSSYGRAHSSPSLSAIAPLLHLFSSLRHVYGGRFCTIALWGANFSECRLSVKVCARLIGSIVPLGFFCRPLLRGRFCVLISVLSGNFWAAETSNFFFPRVVVLATLCVSPRQYNAHGLMVSRPAVGILDRTGASMWAIRCAAAM